MNVSRKFQQWMQDRTSETNTDWDPDLRYRWDRPRGQSPWLGGLTGRSLEMAEVEEEVAAEQVGQVALVGLRHDETVHLLARLRQQPPIQADRPVCREGFFTLVRLGATQPPAEPETDTPPWIDRSWSATDEIEETLDLLRSHDLILYLVRADMGWRSEDAHWFSRLRATRVPLISVVMVQAGGLPLDEATLEGMRKLLGVRPIVVERTDTLPADPFTLPQDLTDLIGRLLSVRPRLALALAQEVPSCRRMIAERVIRTGALMTTLLGSEPIPLLDLPLHIATQWKVALQLSTIYGRPGLDYRSREMIGTVLVSLVVRQMAQQVMKLIPMVGWLLSGLFSGGSTWLFGQALVRYYEEEVILPKAPKVSLDILKESVVSGAEHLRHSGPVTKLARLRQQVASSRNGRDRNGRRQPETTHADAEPQEIPIWDER